MLGKTSIQTKKYSNRRLLWPPEKERTEKVTEIYNHLETQMNQQSQNEIILGGDFSAKQELTHSTGNQTFNRSGKLLQAFLENSDPQRQTLDYGPE